MMKLLKPTQSISGAMKTAKQMRALPTVGKTRAATQRKVAMTQKTRSTSQQQGKNFKQDEEEENGFFDGVAEAVGKGSKKVLSKVFQAADDLTR